MDFFLKYGDLTVQSLLKYHNRIVSNKKTNMKIKGIYQACQMLNVET